MFIRHVKQTNINVIAKRAFEEKDSDLENSVITMYRLGEKTLRCLMEKDPAVYSRDET